MLRTGVFVDAANITLNGGWGMDYGVLRTFAERGAAVGLRFNTYIAYDKDRADVDPEYRKKTHLYQNTLRKKGWKVTLKEVRRYTDENGQTVTKANADLDLAVDALLQSEGLDRILVATGDGDFVQVVRAIQNKGCRVEAVAFDHVSSALKAEVDVFFSGYLIPGLLPLTPPDKSGNHHEDTPWGEPGSRVRGYCNIWFDDKGYGFLHVLTKIDEHTWQTDPQNADSPYCGVYCHNSELASNITTSDLSNRDTIFELTLEKSDREGSAPFRARDVRRIGRS
ncbi:MAG: NYN domain-containing protein [Magnetococcales bacterium]|nr:NYN domain-containing protein [Magnetococcales bacterium]